MSLLPFLKRTQEAGVQMPVPSETREPDKGSDSEGLHAAAEDLMNAVHAKDIKAIASALKAAFELCDEQPHIEGPHLKEES